MATDYTPLIRRCMEAKLTDVSPLPDIMWENVGYEPSARRNFITTAFRVRARPAANRGANPRLRYRGSFRVLVNTALNGGPGPGSEIASSILAMFPPTEDVSLVHVGGTLYVTIETSYQEEGYRGLNHFITPVHISWYVYLPSN